MHALFPKKEIEIRHLHYIMAMDDPTFSPPQSHTGSKPSEDQASGARASESKNIQPHLAKCLRHLRRVDEAVHAAQAMIGPYFKDKKLDQDKLFYVKSELRHHLNEMELLFQDPRLFGHHETFTGVYHLKGKLTFFDSLLAEGYAPAQEYWENEVEEEFRHVMANIFNAFESVMDQA